MDHRNSTLPERQGRDRDYIAGFDNERTEILRKGNHRGVLVAWPRGFGQFVGIGECAERASDLIRILDRFDPQIVTENHIQPIVLEIVVKEMTRAFPVHPGMDGTSLGFFQNPVTRQAPIQKGR